MISTPDRQTAVTLIEEAVTAGARRFKACAELEISARTLRRWTLVAPLRQDRCARINGLWSSALNRATSSVKTNALPC